MRAFASMTAALCRDAFAEGVEMNAQHDFRLELGFRFGRGWPYGKPMSAADFERSCVAVH